MNNWNYHGTSFGPPKPVRKSVLRAIPGDAGPQERHVGDTCKADGCNIVIQPDRVQENGKRSRGGTGGGYCPKHAKNFYRCGDPLGQKVKAWREFTEAVLSWADEQSEQACRRLVGAAWAWYRTTSSTGRRSASKKKAPLPEHTATVDAIARLVHAAERYADADADSMKEFWLARYALRRAAANVWR